jgi:hypothetical protein
MFIPGKWSEYRTNEEKGVCCKPLQINKHGDIVRSSTSLTHGSIAPLVILEYTLVGA